MRTTGQHRIRYILVGASLSVTFYFTSYSQMIVNHHLIYMTDSFPILVNGGVLNTGQLINTGELHIEDGFQNDGQTEGYGFYEVKGDWENNQIFTADTSTVLLSGGAQSILGAAESDFYNLTLSGTGIKLLQQNASATGILDLTDRELATSSQVFTVHNTNDLAIRKQDGFVSSDLGGGLIREMDRDEAYLFPVGSSVDVFRYRPVTIDNIAGAAQIFKVRMANVDPSTEGFQRSSLDSLLCVINHQYYHHISRVMGDDPVNLEIEYDLVQDIESGTVARWGSGNTWIPCEDVIDVQGQPAYYTLAGVDSSAYTEYALAKECVVVELVPPLFIPNAISPNNDGYNDKFIIGGLETYPDNDIVILNRWGNVVYEASPYENDWSGISSDQPLSLASQQLPNGTYFYVLGLGNGENRSGFIDVLSED